MADKRPVLEVRNLTVALPAGADRALAVEKVSFTVSPGEIVCLVGESGSGKSVIAFTVMGLLAKALKPTGGEILLEGENVLAADETRLRDLRCTRMSMIFQEPMTALNPVMTCGAQVDEVLSTTHDFGVVAEIAHRVAVLRWGELVEMGPTEQILARPEHGYTKMLISSVPSIHPQHRGARKDGITVLRTDKLGKTYSGHGF